MCAIPRPPDALVRRIRASYYFIGAQLGRFGHARVALPGGCNFGARPIDQHIKGFEAIGAAVDLKDGFVCAAAPADGLTGGRVNLDVVSVGATMNIMIGAVWRTARPLSKMPRRSRTSSIWRTS